jgi:hypothetical protein
MYARQLGVPIADDCYLGMITGEVEGRPWRDRPITASELPLLVRILVAASFVVLCYLTGARPGEVVALRRGCRGTDPETGELLVHGRRGKGYDRTPLDPVDPTRPWVTVQPVHDAVAMLEALHNADLLWPAQDQPPRRPLRDRHQPAEQGHGEADGLGQRLLSSRGWVGVDPARSDPASTRLPIPQVPRLLHCAAPSRPHRGRPAVLPCLHQGHPQLCRESDTSWLDDLAVERLEMVLEHNDDDWTRLQAGEHVTGPAAREYGTRLAGVARFSGRVVGSVRSVERLLTTADPDIHHGEGMTCVHRAETAECRKEKLTLGLPEDTGPDQAFCRTTCSNLAYTDRDIAQLRDRVVGATARRPWRAERASSSTTTRPPGQPSRAAVTPDEPPAQGPRGRQDSYPGRRRSPAHWNLLRSQSGKLTGSELIVESGVRRDVVYGDHKDLVEQFQAQVRAQAFTPDSLRRITEDNTALREQLADVVKDLAVERERNAALTRIATELSLELDQARTELHSVHHVTRLPIPRTPERH